MENYETKDMMRAAALWFAYKLQGKEADMWKGMLLNGEGKAVFCFADRYGSEAIIESFFHHQIIGDVYEFSDSYFEMRRRLNAFLEPHRSR